MRFPAFRLSGVFLCSTCMLAMGGRALAQGEPATVVATVNGEDITTTDVEEVFRGMIGDKVKTASPESVARVRAENEQAIIEQLISKKLLLKAAVSQEVSSEEVESALVEVKKALTADELNAMQWSDEKLRAEITNDLKINRLIEQRAALLPPPDEAEVKAYYNANIKEFTTPTFLEPRHILISTEGETGDALREKRLQAERLRLRLNAAKGTNFPELAQEHSTCPSAANGGRLGKVGKGQMPEAFDAMAFSLPIGEISPVVETDLGFHIIVVDQRHEATTLSLQEAAPRIFPILTASRKQRVMQDYLGVLKTRARIQRFRPASAGPGE